MASRNDFFIAVYTNEVKDYCDKEFFDNLKKLGKGVMTYVVDNSKGWEYFNKLGKLTGDAGLIKLDVERNPRYSRFQRNVTESVNKLRELFLNTDKKYFLIIESDVIPPKDLIERLSGAIEELDSSWGILGAIYYKGFHDYKLEGLQKELHILSGCTVYKREVIEKFPFRYDEKTIGAFPDAWMSVDAGKDYTLWNDYRIICEHLHTAHGTRISKPL